MDIRGRYQPITSGSPKLVHDDSASATGTQAEIMSPSLSWVPMKDLRTTRNGPEYEEGTEGRSSESKVQRVKERTARTFRTFVYVEVHRLFGLRAAYNVSFPFEFL
jgi:hypothetical protein